MIEDSEIDALRALAERIRHEAECSTYGYFPGGDPREFCPDAEVCSGEELEKHKAACAEWDAGRQKDIGGPHIPLGDIGHVTVAHYGMGTYMYRDPVLSDIAQGLDDLIDRIRQVPR